MKEKLIVLMPVETISRELDYKISIAHKIASKDIACIVAQHNYINEILRFFDGGVYFGKNVFPDLVPSTTKFYDDLKRNNFSLAYFHEEGGVFFGGETEWESRLSSQIDSTLLNSDDSILCWGNFQYNFYNKRKLRNDVFNVGVPRFELQNGSDLKDITVNFNPVKYNDFILINTNFAVFNHMMGQTYELKYFSTREFKKEDHLNEVLLWYSEVFETMGTFLKMIIKLVKDNSEELFVIRPHPTESTEIYDFLSSQFDNLIVSKEFSATNWISNCKLMIQNNCTTSIEAYFLDKPIINYGNKINKHSVNILNDIGIFCDDITDVQKIIDNPNVLENKILKNDSPVTRLIRNFLNDESSSDLIKSILLKKLSKKSKSKIPLLRLRAVHFFKSVRAAIFYLPRLLFPKKLAAYKMFESAFPGFKKDYVVDRINFLNKKNNKSLKSHFLNKELFIITD